MSTITDMSPVLRAANPSANAHAGKTQNTPQNHVETARNAQTTGGVGSDPKTKARNQPNRSEQGQASASITGLERSSKTVGLAPANANAESVVMSKVAGEPAPGLSSDPPETVLETGRIKRRSMAATALDRIRIERLIDGLTEAREAIRDASLRDGAGVPLNVVSPATEAESIRLSGTTY